MRVVVRSDDGDRYYLKTRAAWAFNVKRGERIVLTGRPGLRMRSAEGSWDVHLGRPLRKEAS